MPLEIQAVDLTKPNGIETAAPVDLDILSQAERRQQIASRYISDEILSDTNHLKGANFDKPIATVDKICEHLGQRTLSRMIFELVSKVATVGEQHILQRRNRERDRKDKIEGKVEDQKAIKNWQATTHGIEGAFAGLMFFAGLFIGGNVGKLMEQVAGLSRPAKEMVVNHFDGKLLPLQHESSLYLNEVQSAKQAIESLKNLPEQLRNLMLDLMRQELHAVQSVSQR